MTPNAMPKQGPRVIQVKRWDGDGRPMRQTKLQPLAKPNRSVGEALLRWAD